MPSTDLFDHTARSRWSPGAACALAAGDRILITGAGGSIGGVLARRLASEAPERLILLERSEHALFELERCLGSPAAPVRCVLGDAGDRRLVDRLLARERPRVIFHTAAHKHAPLLESQPFEACRNNLAVTRRLLSAAASGGVERFVLLSTDKAVEPIGMMGFSKWLAEGAIRLVGSPMTATAVRLGNVWGSQGSVIPRFEAQLAAGRCLTVTDPGVRRFFLSFDEAVSAAIGAALYGDAGDRLVPEMGEPLSILGIAERLLHRAGVERPEERIRLTGLRPGDKQEEQLLAEGERLEPTPLNGLHRVVAHPLDRELWAVTLDAIEDAAAARDGTRLLAAMRRLRPQFVPGKRLEAALSLSTHGVPAEISS